MGFSRKIELIEYLLEAAESTNAISDKSFQKISEELLEMKKQEVMEVVGMDIGVIIEDDQKDMCWSAFILGA